MQTYGSAARAGQAGTDRDQRQTDPDPDPGRQPSVGRGAGGSDVGVTSGDQSTALVFGEQLEQ